MGLEDLSNLGGVFFTFKRESGEEHLSPSQLLVTQGAPPGLYPFLGANGVPQHLSPSQIYGTPNLSEEELLSSTNVRRRGTEQERRRSRQEDCELSRLKDYRYCIVPDSSTDSESTYYGSVPNNLYSRTVPDSMYYDNVPASSFPGTGQEYGNLAASVPENLAEVPHQELRTRNTASPTSNTVLGTRNTTPPTSCRTTTLEDTNHAQQVGLLFLEVKIPKVKTNSNVEM